MTLKNYVSFHTHPMSLDSASRPIDFVNRAKELDVGYLACTDHGTLGGCRDIYKLCNTNNIKPILGIEGYVRDPKDPVFEKYNIKEENGVYGEYFKYGHITLHALNQESYEALVKITSKADLRAEVHGQERKPLMDWSDLEYLGSKDITVGAGCIVGLVLRHFINGRPDIAEDFYQKLRSTFKPGNFFVEVMPHIASHKFEDGVFIKTSDGKEERYWSGKKFKISGMDEIKAEELAKLFKKDPSPKKLISIRNRNSWEDLSEPLNIVKCQYVRGFVVNECTPFLTDPDYQKLANKWIISIAKKYGDKILITGDDHFASKEDKIVQDARLGNAGQAWKMFDSYHMLSSEEAWTYFKNVLEIPLKEVEEWIENTRELSSRFDNFKFKDNKFLPTSFYPSDTLSHFKTLVDKHGRMNWSNNSMIERLKSEINLIHKNGVVDLMPYFFINEEALTEYEDNGILTGIGRGSASGLLISYLLGITHLNPLEHGLSQDRFLTKDRIESGRLPDIDSDLPQRDLLHQWLEKRFKGHYAKVSTNSTLHLKSSIKDVARALLGSVPYEIETISESLPIPPQGIKDKDFIFGYHSEDGKEVEGLLSYNKNLQLYTQKYPEHWKIVQRMLEITRGKSVHASAYVLADRPIDEFIPLQTITDTRATQYTAESVEESGGIKIDFLGLNSLKDIQECLELIHQRYNVPKEKYVYIDNIKVPSFKLVPYNGEFYDVYNLPEVQEVFDDICNGKTETVFQLSTEGAQKWLKEFNFKGAMKSIQDIAIFTALDRKGPLDAYITDGFIKRNMLQEYAARKRGEQKIDSLPILDELLPETLGILVYQEQLSKVYQTITGCTGAEANTFRENTAKKKAEKVMKSFPFFMEGAKYKLGEEGAKKLWDSLNTWSGYGFNKGHAVSYGKTAYACSFLKHFYPLEWWCSVLNNATKDEIATKFWRYCKNLVITPDFKYSTEKFYIKDDKIICPLNLIQGVGENSHKELVQGLPYKDIKDFIEKIVITKANKTEINKNSGISKKGTSSLNIGVVSKLIVSGVMDSLFPPNLDTISKLEYYNKIYSEVNKEKPKKISEDYQNLNKLQEYQLKKAIFPIYGEFLGNYVTSIEKKTKDNGVESYIYNPTLEEIGKLLECGGYKKKWWKGNLPIVSSKLLAFLEENYQEGPDNKLTVGVIGYVTNFKKFTYQGNKTAAGVTLDIEGDSFRYVKWPDYKTGKLVLPTEDLKCAIMLCVLSKWKRDKPFNIDSFIVLQTSQGIKNDEKSY